MKRIIAAVSFAALAVPAFAAGTFEQSQLDRALPQFEQNASAGATAERLQRNLPFEQTQLDRVQPDVAIKARLARTAARPTLDHNFIAPAL